jgi:hypothetical protein
MIGAPSNTILFWSKRTSRLWSRESSFEEQALLPQPLTLLKLSQIFYPKGRQLPNSRWRLGVGGPDLAL